MVDVVTGGAGHIGTSLVQSLITEGRAVRVIDIRAAPAGIDGRVEWIRADVRDAAAMTRAMDGARTVYHLAAVISITGEQGGRVHSVNVDGTATVARAALAARVDRFIHCSSIHAYDLSAAIGGIVDETCPRAVDPGLPAYDRSKAAGEEAVRRAVEGGLDAVIVNPTGVLGPPDPWPSRMGTVLLAVWRRRLPAIVDGGFDWVDVRDTVRALRSAADTAVTGENYLVSGSRVSIAELARLASACAGTPTIARTAPDWLIRGLSPVATFLAARSGSGTALLPTPEAVHALRCFPQVDGAKARRRFGHRPRPVEDTLRDLYGYFLRTGRLERRGT